MFLNRLYNSVLDYASKPIYNYFLAFIAFIESCIFPIPVDVFLITACLARSKNAYFYAIICTIFSVLGGILGYFLGSLAFESFFLPILKFYNALDQYDLVKNLYTKYDAYIVFIAGFTPIPYKIFALAAGTFNVNLIIFILMSFLGRALRFFLIAILLKHFGIKMKYWIEKYLAWLTLLIVAIVLMAIIIIKFSI